MFPCQSPHRNLLPKSSMPILARPPVRTTKTSSLSSGTRVINATNALALSQCEGNNLQQILIRFDTFSPDYRQVCMSKLCHVVGEQSYAYAVTHDRTTTLLEKSSIASLNDADWAWEFLRRNPDYKRDYRISRARLLRTIKHTSGSSFIRIRRRCPYAKKWVLI